MFQHDGVVEASDLLHYCTTFSPVCIMFVIQLMPVFEYAKRSVLRGKTSDMIWPRPVSWLESTYKLHLLHMHFIVSSCCRWMSTPFWKNHCKHTLFFFFSFLPPGVDEACIQPFDENDIKLESDLTILLWQPFKSCADNMMLFAIGHIQLPDTKT